MMSGCDLTVEADPQATSARRASCKLQAHNFILFLSAGPAMDQGRHDGVRQETLVDFVAANPKHKSATGSTSPTVRVVCAQRV